MSTSADKSTLSSAQNSESAGTVNRIRLEECAAAMARAGDILLKSGSEVYRVEDLMNSIGDSFPMIDSCTSYVTLTGVMVTVTWKGQFATKIVRVHTIGTNLSKIRLISELAHELIDHPQNPSIVLERLEEIDTIRSYSLWQTALFAAIGAAGFGLFFKAGYMALPWIFICGFLVQLLGSFFGHLPFNRFLMTLFQACFAAIFCCLTAPLCGKHVVVDTMLLSVLMLLVPGMTLTNGLRDTLSGNYLSGVCRFSEALLSGISIAMGAAIGLSLFY